MAVTLAITKVSFIVKKGCASCSVLLLHKDKLHLISKVHLHPQKTIVLKVVISDHPCYIQNDSSKPASSSIDLKLQFLYVDLWSGMVGTVSFAFVLNGLVNFLGKTLIYWFLTLSWAFFAFQICIKASITLSYEKHRR